MYNILENYAKIYFKYIINIDVLTKRTLMIILRKIFHTLLLTF